MLSNQRLQTTTPFLNAQYQFRIGLDYENGTNGHPVNIIKAIESYREAANLKHAEAMNRLGCIYLDGKEVKANPVWAYSFFEEASMHGSKFAQENLDTMHRMFDSEKYLTMLNNVMPQLVARDKIPQINLAGFTIIIRILNDLSLSTLKKSLKIALVASELHDPDTLGIAQELYATIKVADKGKLTQLDKSLKNEGYTVCNVDKGRIARIMIVLGNMHLEVNPRIAYGYFLFAENISSPSEKIKATTHLDNLNRHFASDIKLTLIACIMSNVQFAQEQASPRINKIKCLLANTELSPISKAFELWEAAWPHYDTKHTSNLEKELCEALKEYTLDSLDHFQTRLRHFTALSRLATIKDIVSHHIFWSERNGTRPLKTIQSLLAEDAIDGEYAPRVILWQRIQDEATNVLIGAAKPGLFSSPMHKAVSKLLTAIRDNNDERLSKKQEDLMKDLRSRPYDSIDSEEQTFREDGVKFEL